MGLLTFLFGMSGNKVAPHCFIDQTFDKLTLITMFYLFKDSRKSLAAF